MRRCTWRDDGEGGQCLRDEIEREETERLLRELVREAAAMPPIEGPSDEEIDRLLDRLREQERDNP